MPWALAKDDSKIERLETVIYNLLESIRVGANLLSPFLPETSDKILEQLNNYEKKEKIMDENVYSLNKPTPLFMRIDKNEK
jgi:methionyl-tRNA synthetase